MILGLVLLALCLSACLSACAGELPCPVFAAASIAPVVDRVGRDHKLDYSLHPAASSTLAQQIREGAKAQIFISAHGSWVDVLEQRGLLVEGSRRPLVKNGLVLVATKGSMQPFSLHEDCPLADLLDGRLAIGDPSHVPLGRYAKTALQGLSLWDQVSDKLAPAIDARAALALVERGECLLGVVYATDAAASSHVDIVSRFPSESLPEVVYELALIKGEVTPVGQALYDALLSQAGRAILTEAGFEVIE